MTVIPRGEMFYSDEGIYLATAVEDIDGSSGPLYLDKFGDCTIDIANYKSREPLTMAVIRKFRELRA